MKINEKIMFAYLKNDITRIVCELDRLCKDLERAERVDLYESRKLARKVLESLKQYKFFNEVLSGEIDYDMLMDTIKSKDEQGLKLMRGKADERNR